MVSKHEVKGKMNTFILFGFVLLSSYTAFSAVDEEALLRRKAALVAKKVHMKNLNLIGVDPASCKQSSKPGIIIEQIKNIKSGNLNHCPTVVDSFLKPLNDEIAKVDSGVLDYGPLPKSIVSVPRGKDAEADLRPEVSRPDLIETQEPISIAEVDRDIPIAPTGLSSNDLDRIFNFYEVNQDQYRPSEEDNLFRILSKAYVRNLNRIVPKPENK